MNSNRIKVGIFFGGGSREREVSFAGGRTVYDNLDKELFEAIPIFVDEFGHLVILQWEYVYRGTIRDFYPPVDYLPKSENQFQIYSESLSLDRTSRLEMLSTIGELLSPERLVDTIDFAFLALHGEGGEDGTIQGLLEWYGIPYSGSGILPSSIGMNKAIQKEWMVSKGYDSPKFIRVRKSNWFAAKQSIYESATREVGFPLVVKAANQGSSIGITILKEEGFDDFNNALNTSFFRDSLTKEFWESCDKVQFIRELSDIRSSLGFPLLIDGLKIDHPELALVEIEKGFKQKDLLHLEACRGEIEVVIEQFIEGREFSCIVIRTDSGEIVALPPTEIAKSTNFFDYKSKYLPGLSRKITPIELPDEEIEKIRTSCSSLFNDLGFNVYARIDGFYSKDQRILLNDPNTTSGMMPSSFFFHQAAEIGLNPSQFLTFIIRKSIAERIETAPSFIGAAALLQTLDKARKENQKKVSQKTKVGILMGGYSTERHISVESGRNIFEKLSSSTKYQPIPIFLTGSSEHHRLFTLPVNIMLKDNADDIKAKVEQFHKPEILNKIIEESQEVIDGYTSEAPIFEPKEILYEDLKSLCDSVFIALHGRPGEDGEVQKRLDKLSIPYNGSGVKSSSTTIDKFKTNKILRENGFLVADGLLVQKNEWKNTKAEVLSQVKNMKFPLIAKPSDEGCSSAVKKLKSIKDFEDYAEATFRETAVVDDSLRVSLDIQDKEEFPQKDYFLVEQFIQKNNASHFLEITGGLLTKYKNKTVEYEIFEPSEALAEGEILSLAEKFLAGEGQNITPARFAADSDLNSFVSKEVRKVLKAVAECLEVEGYCRIDAFVRVFENNKVEVVIIEINSLPGMTPATCIYHQAAINGYKPFDFIDEILTFGAERTAHINS